MSTAGSDMLRLRISLQGSEPEIWRLIEVGEYLTLAQLHLVLQTVFGWEDSHLHAFVDEDPWMPRRRGGAGIPRIGLPPRRWVDEWTMNDGADEGEEPESATSIGEAFAHDGPIWYEYDFGDGWIHRIELIERWSAEPEARPVTIVRGARRGPLEDSGGIGGYEEKLAILADPRHPDHEWIAEWTRSVAGPWGSAGLELFDAELFDPEAVQAELDLLTGGGTDMSGLVDAGRGVGEDAPIVAFASLLPVSLRVRLRLHVRRTGLLDDGRGDALDATIARPYLWLLERLGDDGVRLTEAGRMPPALVRQAAADLGWSGLVRRPVTREDQSREMGDLRETAVQLRLVRKYRGRLEPVARTRKVAGDADAIVRLLAHMLLRQRLTDHQLLASATLVIGLADGSLATTADAQRAVLHLLGDLGLTERDGSPLDSKWYYWLTAPVRDVLHLLGLWPDRVYFGTDEPVPSEALRQFARLALR